jgi:hypothetical protein
VKSSAISVSIRAPNPLQPLTRHDSTGSTRPF